MRFTPRSSLRASRTAAGALAAAGSIGLAAMIVMAGIGARPTAQTACSHLAFPPGAGPLAGGVKTTLAGAQAAAGFPILVPDDPGLGRASAAQAWVSRQAVALVYARGKITITMAPATHPDALRWFRTFIAENHAAAAIGQVNGQPALVITPGTDACGTNPAWVEFDHKGLDINISSSSDGTTALLAVAASMKQLP